MRGSRHRSRETKNATKNQSIALNKPCLFTLCTIFIIIIQRPNYEFYEKGANISNNNIHMEWF